MPSLIQQEPGLFKGANHGSCPDLEMPLPTLPFTSHHFPSSAPHRQCNGQSLTTLWLTGVPGLVGSLGAGSALLHSPDYLLLPVSPLSQPSESFGFLTTAEGSCCVQGPSHTEVSMTSRAEVVETSRALGLTSYQDLENACEKVPLLLRAWPWLYDPL